MTAMPHQPLAGSEPALPLPPEQVGGRVLVVDDELPNRAYLKRLLVQRGCEVLEAADGARALELARKARPELALVDVVMPGMSGYDVCAAMQRDPLLREIPVIIVTARTEIEDIERGFLLGAFDYIRKPFNPRELVVRVRNALMLKRRTEEARLWRQRMSRELETAGMLQRKLLAVHPLLTETFEVRSAYHPSMNIGGDVFDVLPLADGGLAVYAGDVSGHGVGPAMLSSMLKAMLTDLINARATRQGPATICTELNVRFRRQVENPEIYATLFLALYRPATRQWQCLNCGHPPPLLFSHRGARAQSLEARGDLPIGVPDIKGAGYDAANEIAVDVAPGAALFLYTDGLTEARRFNSSDELGVAALGEAVASQLRDETHPDVPARVLARLRSDGFRLETDDCTALLVEHVPADEVRLTRAVPPTHAAVADLARDCERALLDEGWSEDAAVAGRLLVTEHGANVVDHGHLPPEARIAFQLRVRQRMARLLFRDPGLEWDQVEQLRWSSSRTPDADHGRGLAIIQAIAIACEQFRRDRENIASYLISADFDAIMAHKNPMT